MAARIVTATSVSALLIFSAMPAFAAHYYLSPTGNDSNAGTQAAPWRTIAKADTVTAPGDTVHAAPGTYAGAKTVKDGTSGSHIKYVSDTPWAAKVNTAAANATDTLWFVAGDYTDVIGFEVDGTATANSVNGGIFLAGVGSTAQGNNVHHVSVGGCYYNGAAGISLDGYYGGSGQTASGNYVHDVGGPGCGSSWLWHGIYISATDATVASLVANNRVENIPSGFGAHVWHNGRKAKVYNNTFVNVAGCFLFGSGEYYNGFTSSGSGGNIAANNICSGASTGFNESGATETANTYTNNLEFNITNRVTGTMQTSYLQNAVLGDPKFVSSTDRHLQSTSPAISAASATYAPSIDYDAVARPQGAGDDIGAFEYVASGPPPGCYDVANAWQNAGITSQAGAFTFEFDVTPNAASIDAVVGLSQSAAGAYTSLATIVAFETSGIIDVIDGPTYHADASYSYVSGHKYHVRMVVSVLTHKYDVYVKDVTTGAAEVKIANQYAFRDTQALVSSLANVGMIVSSGSDQVCALVVTPTPAPTLSFKPNQLGWSTTGATSCTPTGFSGSGTAGNATINPGASGSYSLTCTGPGGSVTGTVSTTSSKP